MTELLEGKTAIIYGGGGIGGGVARTVAREGATLFLLGRTREKLDAVARDSTSVDGSARVTVLNALDKQAVEVAAFLASDRAAGMTGGMANVTRGLVLR